MIQAGAHRGKENKWVCGFGSMALYVGSANKADDLAKEVNKGLVEFGQMRAERIEYKGRLQWCARIGTYIIKGFGNSANNADDFAKEFNAVVAGAPQPLPTTPTVPVPEMGVIEGLQVYEAPLADEGEAQQ